MDEPQANEQQAITMLLAQVKEGDSGATEEIWQQMYSEIHRVARGLTSKENMTPTIQASVLINEAYLRIFSGTIPKWKNSHHFINTVAKSMGHFLIDHARSRKASKRGGGKQPVSLTIAAGELADYNTANSIGAAEAVEALELLACESPDAAEVARLRFILGLSVEQTAEAINMAPRTVKKKWAYAKAWLRHRLDANGE